jgi:hypothetical protein
VLAAVVAAETAIQMILRRENKQAIFIIEIFALNQRLWLAIDCGKLCAFLTKIGSL